MQFQDQIKKLNHIFGTFTKKAWLFKTIHLFMELSSVFQKFVRLIFFNTRYQDDSGVVFLKS